MSTISLKSDSAPLASKNKITQFIIRIERKQEDVRRSFEKWSNRWLQKIKSQNSK
jgi:hypothetical protein